MAVTKQGAHVVAGLHVKVWDLGDPQADHHLTVRCAGSDMDTALDLVCTCGWCTDDIVCPVCGRAWLARNPTAAGELRALPAARPEP